MLLIMATVPRPDKPSSRYRIRRIPKFDFARSIFGNMGIPFFSRVLAVAGKTRVSGLTLLFAHSREK